MTDRDSITSVDFSAPRRMTGNANRALISWQKSALQILQENWQSLLGSGITLTAVSTDSCVARKAIGELADPGFAARVLIGEPGFPSLIAFSDRLVQLIVAEMLGVTLEAWPESRPVTPAEESMVELLFGEVARSLSMAWPQVERLNCQLEGVVARPTRSRIYPPEEVMARTVVEIQTRLGRDEAFIVHPRSGLASIGISDLSSGDTSVPRPASQLRQLAEKLPVRLAVQLGTARLSLADMNQLNVGDVLVLEQSVRRPLQATIEGQRHWIGTPCRLGQQQGFRILGNVDEQGGRQ
ncbi:MAG: FliM/FliN family flagellar motor switch protein [Planctomyces sp.]|nr:FliM/FliN family flagellar motor switch protein [Planctomyces sp.]